MEACRWLVQPLGPRRGYTSQVFYFPLLHIKSKTQNSVRVLAVHKCQWFMAKAYGKNIRWKLPRKLRRETRWRRWSGAARLPGGPEGHPLASWALGPGGKLLHVRHCATLFGDQCGALGLGGEEGGAGTSSSCLSVNLEFLGRKVLYSIEQHLKFPP